ncbi:hypothetical protein [Polycladidibacter hongkongensis]|uniref:hypothetical protein n=1 Tax=Polycladidibacter hongkongensis TaxID=1647556 RepID=UPI00082A6218|nr:hypothetical protein [Pseudovibrio hongkongensis]
MYMIVAEAKLQGERDLLEGHELESLIYVADDKEIDRIPAGDNPWTHERLNAVECPEPVVSAIASGKAVDVYVGRQWIGSSEL